MHIFLNVRFRTIVHRCSRYWHNAKWFDCGIVFLKFIADQYVAYIKFIRLSAR